MLHHLQSSTDKNKKPDKTLRLLSPPFELTTTEKGMRCIQRNSTALQPWDTQSRCIRHRVVIWGSDNKLRKSSYWKRRPSRHVSLSIPKYALTDALLCTVVHVSCRLGSAAVLHITTSASGPWINRKGGEQEAGSVTSHYPRTRHSKTAVQFQWKLVKRGNPFGLKSPIVAQWMRSAISDSDDERWKRWAHLGLWFPVGPPPGLLGKWKDKRGVAHITLHACIWTNNSQDIWSETTEEVNHRRSFLAWKRQASFGCESPEDHLQVLIRACWFGCSSNVLFVLEVKRSKLR